MGDPDPDKAEKGGHDKSQNQFDTVLDSPVVADSGEPCAVQFGIFRK
jgi:hypothetical protein